MLQSYHNMVITDNVISSFYSQYLGVNINMSKCGVCLQPNKAHFTSHMSQFSHGYTWN